MSNFSFSSARQADGTLPRLTLAGIMDKIQSGRSAAYTVTSTDVTNKYTAAISLTWDKPFADTNYTVLLGIEGSSLTARAYAVAHFTKTASGISVVVSAPNGTAGDTLVVHASAIHD